MLAESVDLDYLLGKYLCRGRVSVEDVGISSSSSGSLPVPFASDCLYVGWYGKEYRNLWQVDFAGCQRLLDRYKEVELFKDEHTLAGRVLLDYQYFGDLESLYTYVNSREAKMYRSVGLSYTFGLVEFAGLVGVSVGFIEELVRFGVVGYVAFISIDGFSKGEPLFGLEHLVQFRKRLGVRLPLVVKV